MRTTTRVLSLATLVAVAVPAMLSAQIPQSIPFPRTLDLLLVDSTFDGVWRKADRNQDGDYNDAGEITVYYDDVNGAFALGNPNCVAFGPYGTAYVGDSSVDIILALNDLDGNGDALGAGEHTVFFDNTNLSNVIMGSVQGLAVDAIGNVFGAVADTSGGGVDMIMRLSDLNGDGDANDANEASVYCQIPNGSVSLGTSIPTEVVIAPDGNIYYAEVGTGASPVKGVYRLVDVNGDGDCNDPGEYGVFWTPPAVGNAFYWGLAVDRAGVFYLTDHGNEQVWRGVDANGDGMISGPAEENLFYQTAASTWWDVIIHPTGKVYLCEDQTPDRITVLEDLNGNLDAMDPGEAYDAYDDTISATATRPRAGAFMRGPILVVQPGSVARGQSVSLTVIASKPGDLAGLLLSDRLLVAPFAFPPFGEFEVNPQVLFAIASGIADAQAVFQVRLPVPNDPSLVGTLAFQAVAGDSFRLYLSNGAPLTII